MHDMGLGPLIFLIGLALFVAIFWYFGRGPESRG